MGCAVKGEGDPGEGEGRLRWMKPREQGQRCWEDNSAYQRWRGDQFGGTDRILKIFCLRVDLSTPLPMLDWQKMGTHPGYFISRVT